MQSRTTFILSHIHGSMTECFGVSWSVSERLGRSTHIYGQFPHNHGGYTYEYRIVTSGPVRRLRKIIFELFKNFCPPPTENEISADMTPERIGELTVFSRSLHVAYRRSTNAAGCQKWPSVARPSAQFVVMRLYVTHALGP